MKRFIQAEVLMLSTATVILEGTRRSDSSKVFEAMSRRLSFSRVAEEPHLTQPAVSTQVKKLEERTGWRCSSNSVRRTS